MLSLFGLCTCGGSIVSRLIALAVLALGVWSHVAVAQVPTGRIYVLHSQASDGCPPLDWHVVVDANDVMGGMIAWDGMQTMARATGRVDRKNHTFAMTAIELEGQRRTATVDGKIEDTGTVIANIKGPNVTCRSVVIRPFVAPSTAR